VLLLPIFKNSIPYEAQYRLEGSTFTFKFNYNMVGDFFTVDLIKRGEVLVAGEKIVYGKALFTSYPADDRLPFPAIIPVDLSLHASRAGWNELMESVYLYMPLPADVEEMTSEVD